MTNQLSQALSNTKKALIVLPKDPYYDQVAAALGLYLSLKDQFNISVYSSNPMTVEFNRLVGVDKIMEDIGKKNLVIRFDPNYNPEKAIDHVFYDMDDNGFRLVVIPKDGFEAPKQDQVILTYSGLDADTLILIGGLHEKHFPLLQKEETKNANLVHIGIGPLSFEENRNVNSLAFPASSISEATARLLQESGYPIEADIASNLLTGIYEGTNNFASSNISAETFQTAAGLMQLGGKNVNLERPQKQTYPEGSIPQSQPQTAEKKDEEQNMPTLSSSPPPFAQKESVELVGEAENEPQYPESWLTPKVFKGTSKS